jgi:2-methylaconitate cis-trans-isomerase PrpF
MLRCAICRGGTSRGVYIHRNELPADPLRRDRVLLAIYGSPDVRQIDGLGGADPLTSKVAIIGSPTRPDADVDYLFGQVNISKPSVDYRGNCGNISAGVGPFAIDEGLVPPVEPVTKVRIHQVNTNRIIVAEVPTISGKAAIEGDYAIDGVPGTGARIKLDFADSTGSVTGKLLPTGRVIEELKVETGSVEVSIVDAANPTVFCQMSDFGLKGTETPREIDSNRQLSKRIEEVRGASAELIGVVKNRRLAAVQSPYVPFIALVGEAMTYPKYTTGEVVKAKDVDLVSRLSFMQQMHKAYPATGTICTAVAAKISGTIVNRVLSHRNRRGEVRIGHPAGIIAAEVEVRKTDSGFQVRRAAIGRTARRIMEGYVYVPRKLFVSRTGKAKLVS